jgi:thiol-disulfide isomerase/thioredoxin
MTSLLLAVALAAPPSFEDAAGTKVTLDEPGVLYLVDFWAEGCKGCIEELPELERLAKEYEPGGRFKLISVLWGGWKGEELRKSAKRYNVEHGFHSDPEGWLEKLGKPAFPTKVLIRDGTVLMQKTGGGAGAYRYWKNVVDRALAEAERPATP